MTIESTANTGISTLFNLFQYMDEVRRESFAKTPPNQQKRVMGLTVRQTSALVNVEMLTRNEPQGIALKTLAQTLQMTVPATSLLVENMVNKGFLERTPNPYDRRAVCIRLSEDGADFIQATRSHVAKELEKSLSVLTPADLATLETIVDKLINAHYSQKTA
ncbi:MAG: MarR family transcriptional regulator [Akkermansia sp.]|nr:MarR family transcriptional regulator [Akkermansia sp.]